MPTTYPSIHQSSCSIQFTLYHKCFKNLLLGFASVCHAPRLSARVRGPNYGGYMLHKIPVFLQHSVPFCYLKVDPDHRRWLILLFVTTHFGTKNCSGRETLYNLLSVLETQLCSSSVDSWEYYAFLGYFGCAHLHPN